MESTAGRTFSRTSARTFAPLVDVGLVFPDGLDNAAAGLENLAKLALGVRHALLDLLRPQAGGCCAVFENKGFTFLGNGVNLILMLGFASGVAWDHRDAEEVLRLSGGKRFPPLCF